MAVDNEDGWIRELGSLVSQGGPEGTLLPQKEYDVIVRRIVHNIQEARVSLVEVLRPLEAYLVTEDDVPRCRAVSFFAELLAQFPGLMAARDVDVHYLAEFFTAKLLDLSTLHGALLGCQAVLGSGQMGEEDAVAMLKMIQDGVYIRSLSVKDRQLALSIIDEIVLSCGKQGLDADIDLAELVVVSIDGEKDPRCLLAGFDVATHVMKLFASLDSDSVHVEYMESVCEEMFDILSCYFPVAFTPSDDDEASITRDDLAQALQATLLAWPGFRTYVLDLVEEKMSSVMKQAKKDSLCLLMGLSHVDGHAVCAESRRVWNMLRPQLMMAFFDGKEYAPSFQSAQDVGIGDDALKCLAECLQACNALPNKSTDETKNPLAAQVLSDVAIEDALTCLEHSAVDRDADAFIRAVASVRSSYVILKACSMAGGQAMAEAMHTVSPRIFQCLEQPPDVCQEAVCLGHLLLHSLVAGEGASDGTNAKTVEEVAERILDIALKFSDLVGEDENTADKAWTGDEFSWPTNQTAYSTATLALTKLHICHTMIQTRTFHNVWTVERINKVVDGLIQCLLQAQADTSITSVAERSLVDVCAMPQLPSPFDHIKHILSHIDYKEAQQVQRMFRVVSQLCVKEPVLCSEAFQCIHKQLSDETAPLAIKALAILENSLGDESECDPIEIDILTMLITSSQEDNQSSTDDVLQTCFKICLKSSPSIQQDIIMQYSNIFLELDQRPVVSQYSAIGVLLGLDKQSVIAMMVHQEDTSQDSIIQRLVQLSGRHDTNQHGENKWYRICLASLLNKCIPEKNEMVESVLSTLLNHARETQHPMDWACLEVCCKAIAKCGGSLETIVTHMCTNIDERDHAHSLLQALLTESPDDTWIQTKAHAQVKFLWQQRTYETMKFIIMSSYSAEESVAREHALIHLIAGAPDAIIDSDTTCVTRTTSGFLSKSECVNTYLSSDDASKILENVLSTFKTLLQSEKARDMMQPVMSHILPNLITVVTSAYYSVSRRLALECLEKIGALVPYQSIHQFRNDVIKASTSACDDLKRHVRFAAAACRQQWSL
ncbi:MMS19 nucleotide excision repair protein-like protein [Picochlorum sp. SENEW3]|nr:MMS19 nucleotide excision repair protein-like protein [Picochlorum sp. SENEW3]WPT18424.1 MMS19 nucleotide excision repair protein-like protein [Picochlorum sp. SENEW3]